MNSGFSWKIRAIGYEPQVPLREGLKRFLAWAGAVYR
jgi:nucleoside-diphosphate-sugar epimerase